jgi:hypothetical protein
MSRLASWHLFPGDRALLLLSLISSLGCGRSLSDVTGTVTYKSKELTFGYVTILASDGIFRNAKIEENGTYQFSGIPVGNARFAVSAIDPKVQEAAMKQIAKPLFTGEPRAASAGKSAKPPTDPMAQASVIPPEYGDVTTSHLEFQVEPGHNTYDIPLK